MNTWSEARFIEQLFYKASDGHYIFMGQASGSWNTAVEQITDGRQDRLEARLRNRLSTGSTSAYIIKSYQYVFIFPKFRGSLVKT